MILATVSTTEVCVLLAKTKNFGQAQFLNCAQSLFEFFALGIILGKNQHLLMTAIGQFGGQNQEVGANRIQSSAQIFFGQR